MVEAPCYVRAERHSPYASRIRTGVGWDLLVHDVDLVVRANPAAAEAPFTELQQTLKSLSHKAIRRLEASA